LELRFSAEPGAVFTPGAARTAPAEAVSGMRQMLTRMIAGGQWPQVVALTSAVRGEGVSFTALALSAVLSQDTTRPTCLVEANWYGPAMLTPGEGQDGGGLAAVLEGSLELERALIQMRNANAAQGGLAFLPAGQMPQTRRVIAARSPEMKAVVAALRQRFQYIVLDLPAVLVSSDAIALAGLADATCLVTQQGVTPAAAVQEALAALRHLPIAGVIMNAVRVHMPAGLAGQLTAPLPRETGFAAGAGQIA
jgi:Mrp family chromosome partitioning ATPase